MTVVTVLGAGVMGTALTFPLADNGHEVRLVGTHLDREIIDRIRAHRRHPNLRPPVPETVCPYQVEEAPAAFDGAEVILSGVNSFGVHWAGEKMAPLLKPGMLVIAVTKGLEATPAGDLRILPDVLAEHIPEKIRKQVAWAAIGGPSIAGELAQRYQTCVVFAGRELEPLRRLAAIFRTAYYHVWTSTDLVGVEVCAALKNSYAISVGLAEGWLQAAGQSESVDRMHNYEAGLFTQATREIEQFVALCGGRAESAYGLAGVGDLFVTSMGGRNLRLGRLLGAGLAYSQARERLAGVTLEGAEAIKVVGAALPQLEARGLIRPEEFPLMRQLYEIIANDAPAEIPWSRFLRGELTGI